MAEKRVEIEGNENDVDEAESREKLRPGSRRVAMILVPYANVALTRTAKSSVWLRRPNR